MKNNIPKPLQNAMKKNGLDPNHLNQQDAAKLMKSLSKEDAEKLNSILQNKQALNQVLNSAQAQSIMKSLFGEK